MSELIACRACLATNVLLYRASSQYTQEVYQHLTNIAFLGMDGKPQLFCFECHSYMQRCRDFRDRCLRADGVLNQLMLSEVGLSQKSVGMFDRCSYNLTSKLTLSQVETIDISPSSIIKNEIKGVKKELLPDVNHLIGTEKVKVEDNDNNDEPDDHDNNDEPDDDDNQSYKELDSESDDNVPLKALSKKRKVKRTVRAKKKIKKEEISSNRGSSGFKEDFAKEIILTEDQQMAELNERAKSLNYIHSPFRCDMCFKGFVDDAAFRNHMDKHDKKNGEFECQICHLRYPGARQLRAHSFTVHCRKYDCVRCGHRSQTAHQAREHEKWHRGYTYECKLCGQKFTKPTSHLTHMRKNHPTEHVCVICGDSFVGRHGLLMHTSKTHRHHEHKEAGPESARFCGECNILFSSADAWRRHVVTSLKHVLTSSGDACRVCGATFPTATELTRHMKTHKTSAPKPTHHTVSLPCAQCPRRFTNKSKLQAHVRRAHLGLKYNKRVVCELCGRHCTSLATLRYHQRTHTGERPYPCTSCEKRFSDSNQLRIHTRTHTDSRPYSCELCEKRFRQRPALNRHMRVHTGAKPFSCQYCQKCFSQSNSLKLHVRTVHFKLPPNNRKGKGQNAMTASVELSQVSVLHSL